MKLISFAVPCYNSAAYMHNCIDHLLEAGGEDIEILIVDDGSRKDNTLEIAKKYEAEHPGVVKAIHQENGGHGSAVNTGLKHAEGLYFKVVDSDDYLDPEALRKVMKKLSHLMQRGELVDMFLCNYVYDKVGQTHKKVVSYRNVLPQDRVFGWEEVRRFRLGQYILMHSVIYRTELLRGCRLELPEHTFYVDNIFVYYPLPYVKKIYYMDVNLYRYYIGREDQSVNEQIMIGRIDQQITVTKLMISYYDVMKIMPVRLRNYMISYVSIMMTVSSILAIRSGTKENMAKKEALWAYLKETSPALYWRLRVSFLGQAMNFKTKAGNRLTESAYKVCQRIYGFN